MMVPPIGGLLRAACCPTPRVLADCERTRRCRSALFDKAGGQQFCTHDLSGYSVQSPRYRRAADAIPALGAGATTRLVEATAGPSRTALGASVGDLQHRGGRFRSYR